MDSKKDQIILPREFPLGVFNTCGSIDTFPLLHWHDCLELNYVKSGTGVNVIADTQYAIKPGEVYVINNNERHYAFSDGTLELLVIVFDPILVWSGNTFDYEFLKPFFERRTNFCNLIGVSNAFSIDIGNLMQEVESEFNGQKPGYQLMIKASIMKILALLYRYFKIEDQIGSEVLERQQDFNRIRKAVSYIESNYDQKINLEYLAQISYMNPTYFSAFFKKVMHLSITDYQITLRINHATRLLKQTSKSITEICSESGFSSLSHFNRTFKRYTNTSPRQYRFEQRQ